MKLKESAAKLDFVFTDAWDYYEIPGVEATMVKGQLIIQIPVMLPSTDQVPAVLHVVDKVWVPAVNETGLYTQVNSLPEFLAVSTGGEVTKVDQHKLAKCAMVQSVWLCPFLHWASEDSCAATIYNNDEWGHVYEQCKFTVKERQPLQPVVLFTEQRLLIADALEPWTTKCSKQEDKVFSVAYAVLPRYSMCNCVLNIGKHAIRSTLTECANTTGDLSLQFHVNQAVVAAWSEFNTEF